MASTLWKKSYDELGLQRASVEQSQFPHGQEYATILTTGWVMVCWERITLEPLMGN